MKLFQIFSLAFLAAFLIFGGNFIIPRFFEGSKMEKEIAALKIENESLKAALKIPRQEIGALKTARVYSTYPFNNRHELLVALGQTDGIKEGMPAVLPGNVILGQVAKVFENHSLIRTVFDPEWKLSVRLGDVGINSLLVGGPEPRLTLINKKSPLNEGDLIYSAASGFPYGSLIGRVGQVIDSPTAVFKEAEVVFPYELDNKVTELQILISYGG